MEHLHHILIQLNMLSQTPHFMSLLQAIILPQFMNLPQYQWFLIIDLVYLQLRLQSIQCTM